MGLDTSLSTYPGAQLQGLNTQGVDVNKDYVSVSIDFVDPATNLYFDPTTYSVNVTQNAAPYTLQKEMVPLSRKDDTVGVWGHSFLTTGMTVGDYVLSYFGQKGAMGPVTKTLAFSAKETPVEQYFVAALRMKLWDKRASRYLIDDNMRQRYTDSDLYGFCDNARIKVGQTPPSPMMLSWEQAYSEAHDLLLTGAFIETLMAAGVFELQNRFTYSDELTLNVDRSGFYQNALSLMQQWQTAVLAWKRDRQFHAVRAIGMASGRFPLYYSRVLSLSVANAGSTFSG